MATIANRIDRLWRGQGRWQSEREFIRAAGLSEGYLSQLRDRIAKEPTTTITADALMKLATALRVSPEDLLGGSGTRPSLSPAALELTKAIEGLVLEGWPRREVEEAAGAVSVDGSEEPDAAWWRAAVLMELTARRRGIRPRFQ